MQAGLHMVVWYAAIYVLAMCDAWAVRGEAGISGLGPAKQPALRDPVAYKCLSYDSSSVSRRRPNTSRRQTQPTLGEKRRFGGTYKIM